MEIAFKIDCKRRFRLVNKNKNVTSFVCDISRGFNVRHTKHKSVVNTLL